MQTTRYTRPQNLINKGLTQVSGAADLNVRYTLGSARKKEIETLVIDLRDTAPVPQFGARSQ